ncbi:chaoptin [Anabrus simplex]|uniref:chaoptin n=1 Tax=Anabrus simplex TaxID=316456 RepID=UPI0035A34113
MFHHTWWLLLLCWFYSSQATSVSPCSLCHDRNASRCVDKRLISLDDLKTRERVSELQISYNNIPKLTDHMFKELGFSSLKRIHCKHCGINEIEPRAFQGLFTLKFIHLSSNNIYQLYPHTFQGLDKLRILDLNDNKLVHIEALDSISSLQYCYLAENFITSLRNESFCSLEVCEMIILDLSNNLISAVEVNAFKGLILLQDLNLSFNNIQYLHPDTFLHSTSLYNLNLQENRLHRLDFIQNVPWVGLLDVSYNNISVLVNDVFTAHNISQLRKLKLDNNKISIMEIGALNNMEHLVYLDLSNNQIDFIPSGIFSETPNLETIKLNNNYLSTLEFVRSIKKVRFLYLSRNRVVTLTPRTFFPKHVHTVDLSNNMINTIQPSTFLGINKLLHLNLQGNNITFVPSNVFERTHVSDIDLKGNEISDINFVLHGLSFRLLHLPSNNLSTFPEEIYSQSQTYTISEMNLSNNGITVLKPGIFNRLFDLRTLNLSKNKLRSLPKDIFHNTNSLTTLMLDYNELVDVAFVSSCVNLKYLYLQGNKITTIPNASFLNVENPQDSKIEVLNLESNEISIIEEGAFQGMHHLKKLIISRNRVTTLYLQTLKYPSNLRLLDFSYNIFSQMDFVPYTPYLKRLQLTNNGIYVLPKNAFTNSSHSQLYVIDLSNNEITTIDKMAFQGLRDLTTLNLSGNNITYLYPKSFQDSIYLSSLDLSHNNISEIYIFDHIPSLRSCNLADNIISVLHNQMFSHTNTSKLCKLSLANNRITTIEYHAFSGLYQLKDLDISGNNISIIHPQTFSFFRNLLRLDISNNKIYHPDFIQNMPLLRHLHLANNNIHILQNNTFASSQISQVIHLNLSHNRIFKVEEMAFQGLNMLRFLDLSRNSISSLPVNVFENNSLLSAIDLSNNHISQTEFILYLRNLLFCNLSSNQILILGNNSFSNSKINRLKFIDISNNKIMLIEHRAFQGLPKLEHLDLSANNISYLYSDILEHSPKLKSLDLRNYPTNWSGKEVIDFLKFADDALKDIRGHYRMSWDGYVTNNR